MFSLNQNSSTRNCFHHFSSSLELNDSLLEQEQHKYDLIISSLAEAIEAEQIPRKRSGKRDRHSKIKTAKGLRDRRMRLSLEVAKRFFGLQDLLGFDKASKTVEWLLNHANAEIKLLNQSTTSECDASARDQFQRNNNRNSSSRGNKNVCRKSAFSSVGREKARERARERTREKNIMRTRGVTPQHQHHDDRNRSVQHSQPIMEQQHHSNSFKWNQISGILLHQNHNQFGEFETLGKPWEAYNNQI